MNPSQHTTANANPSGGPNSVVYSQGHGRDAGVPGVQYAMVSEHHGRYQQQQHQQQQHQQQQQTQLRHPVPSAPNPNEPQRPRIPSSVEAYATRQPPPPPLQHPQSHPYAHAGPSSSPTVDSPQTYSHRQYSSAHLHSPPTTSASPPFPGSPTLHFRYDSSNQGPASANQQQPQSRASSVGLSHPQQQPPLPTHIVQSHSRRSSYGPPQPQPQPQQPPHGDREPPIRRTSTSGMPPPNAAVKGGNGIPTPPPSAVPVHHQSQRANAVVRSSSQVQPQPQPKHHVQPSSSQQPVHSQHQPPPPPHVHSQSQPQPTPQPTSQTHPHPASHPTQPPPPPPTDPLVLASAEAALAPMRIHLENAWKSATSNVHQAMEKMHLDYTSLATFERKKSLQLKQSLAHAEAKLRLSEEHVGSLRSAAVELESLRKDYGELEDDNVTQRRKNAELRRRVEELEGINEGLMKENAGLKDGLEAAARIVDGYKRRGGEKDIDYMTTVLSAVTDKVLESKMNTVLSEIQEQRALRMAAEQKLKQLEEERISPAIPQQQPRRVSKHELPRMITLSQTSSRRPSSNFPSSSSPASSSPLVSPQILARAPPVTRLPHPHPSSPTTSDIEIVEIAPPPPMPLPPVTVAPMTKRKRPLLDHPTARIISPPACSVVGTAPEIVPPPPLPPVTKRKRSSPVDVHRGDQPSVRIISPPACSVVVDPQRGDSKRPSPPCSVVNDTNAQARSRSRSPPRKKSRTLYDELAVDIPRIDHSPEPASLRSSSTPVAFSSGVGAVKEEVDELMEVDEPHATTTTTRTRTSTPRIITTMTQKTTPTIPLKEEEDELEEGEVVSEPEPQPLSQRPKSKQPHPQPQPQPQPSRSLPPKIQKQNSKTKLGITHIDLLYSHEGSSLVCQMCLTRKQELTSASDRRCQLKSTSSSPPVQRFPDDASWNDLIGHCRAEHPMACQDLEKLKPSQIAEMKQRMRAGVRGGR